MMLGKGIKKFYKLLLLKKLISEDQESIEKPWFRFSKSICRAELGLKILNFISGLKYLIGINIIRHLYMRFAIPCIASASNNINPEFVF